jgi:hypothetical protein
MKKLGYLQNVLVVQGVHGLNDTVNHGNFSSTDEDTGIVVLLVGLLGTFGVTNLGLEVGLVLFVKVTETNPVSPLGIGINVHLDNTKAEGSGDFLFGGTGTTVEDKVDGLGVISLELFLDISLVLTQKFGVELDVTGSIDTVDVTESSGNGEEVGDLGEATVDFPDIFGLSVKGRVVDIRVINTIFLTTGDTDFHLEETLHGSHTLEVLETDFNVFFHGIFREI